MSSLMRGEIRAGISLLTSEFSGRQLGAPHFFELFEGAPEGVWHEEVRPDDTEEGDGTVDEADPGAEPGVLVVEEVRQAKGHGELQTRLSPDTRSLRLSMEALTSHTVWMT